MEEENAEAAGLRNRKLNLDAGSSSASDSKVPVKKEKEEWDAHVDGDDWWSTVTSWIRTLMCTVMLAVTTMTWILIMVVLLPWPNLRIRQANYYGHITGRLLLWILGNPIKIQGAEYSKERAVYISNHASPLDVFLAMWLTPTGTVAIAKKEIIWYPLFGQLYLLANHLRIDRSNPTRAIESMKEGVHKIAKYNLSLIIFPEGTRSKSGRLLPFKKGFVHMALQSGLPIVPIVFTGTHLAWRKNSFHLRPSPLTVKFLPPIKTSDWTADKTEDYVKLVHEIYVEHLPESQRPLRQN